MLEIQGLDYGYDQIPIIKNFNLKVENHEIVALIGQSGCGKTTLLNNIATILKPDKGYIYLNQKEISSFDNRLGLVMQDSGLLPWLNVRENCLLSFKIRKEKITEQVVDRLGQILKELNLKAYENRFISTLSGGQKQRVALARLFLLEPEVILLDEAFSSLDLLHKDEAIALFLKLWEERKTPTIMVTHSIDEALYMATKMVILNDKGQQIKILNNPLFKEKQYRMKPNYGTLYAEIEDLIKEVSYETV